MSDTSGGAVYVDILPDIKRFGAALRTGLAGVGKREGKHFGDEFVSAFSESVVPGMVRAVRRGVDEARRTAGKVHVDVEADTRGARRSIEELARDRRLSVKVDADTARARSEVDRLAQSSSTATLRASTLALALASIGPIAVPAIGAATVAVVGLGSTMGALISAVGVGAAAFHGVGDAVKAYGDAQDATGTKVRSATSAALEQAQAHQAAAGRASSMAGALRQVEGAERNVAEAARNTRMAQLDLNDARKEAARVLDDLRDRTREGALSEKEANLAVRQAEEDLRRAQLDPRSSGLDIESARLRVERARQSLAQQQKDNVRLTKDRAEAERKGVKGSDQVRAAQERIRDAMISQRDAQRALAEAQRNVAETSKSNAISAKIQALQAEKTREAMAGQSAEAKRLEKALDGLGPKGRKFAKYLNDNWRPLLRSLKVEAENALLPSVQTALTHLEPIVPKLRSFVGKVGQATGDVITKATKAFSGRDMTRFFTYLEKTAPNLIRTFGGVGISIARILANVMVAAGPAGQQLLGDIAMVMQKIADWTSSAQGQDKLRKFFDDTVPVIEALARLAFQLLRTVGILMQSEGFKGFIDGLTGAVDAFNDFAAANPGAVEAGLWGIFAALVAIKGLQAGKAMRDALAWLPGFGGKGKVATGKGAGGLVGLESLPMVAGGVSEKLPKRKGVKLSPELKGISKTVGGGSRLSKIGKVVGKGGGPIGLAAGIGASIVGSKVADGHGGARDVGGKALSYGATGAGIGALVGSVVPVIGTAIGAAIGGLAGAIYGAWQALGTDTVVGFFKAIGSKLADFGGWLNDKLLKPMRPVFSAVGRLFTWLYQEIIRPVFTLIRVAFDVLWAVVQVIFGLMQIQLKITGRMIMSLWRTIVRPVLGWIADKFLWAWDKIQPVLDALGGYIDRHVAPQFRKAVRGLGSIWESLQDTAKKPISFIIDTVLNNGLLKAYNWLAKKFGVKPDDVHVDNPFTRAPKNNDRSTHREFASGGILPGYSPGRDVHRFTSATGGTLDLSGGEGILRPEVVRALGPATVHALNAAARRGRAFSLGGILGKIGDLVMSPKDGLRKILEDVLGRMPAGSSDLGKVVAGAPRKLLAGAVAKLGSLFGGGDENGGSGVYSLPTGGTATGAGLVAFGHWLQSLGYTVSEHPAFGGVTAGAHVRGSAHYAGRAIDVNHGAGTSSAEQSWLRKIIGPAHQQGFKTIFMAPGHYNHAHIAYDRGGWLQPGTSVVQNNTGRPEPVFTGQQFDQMITSKGTGESTYITVQRTEDGRIARQIVFEQQRRELADRLAGASTF